MTSRHTTRSRVAQVAGADTEICLDDLEVKSRNLNPLVAHLLALALRRNETEARLSALRFSFLCTTNNDITPPYSRTNICTIFLLFVQ